MLNIFQYFNVNSSEQQIGSSSNIIFIIFIYPMLFIKTLVVVFKASIDMVFKVKRFVE